MAGTLSPRGRLVIQTVNFDRVLAESRATFPVIERALPDGGRVAFFREYDLGGLPGRILFRTRLLTPGGEQRAQWPLLPLRSDEVVRFLREAGLPAVREFGDYDLRAFSESSPALIVVGQTAAGGQS
jgi:hypothetical protein